MAKRSSSDNPAIPEKVGYGRPPQHTRFQKGRSGNPKGRPKGSLNVKSMIQKRLLALVNVRENGKSRRVPTLEALIVKALNEALLGRPKPFIEVFKLLQAANLFSLEELDEPTPYYHPASRVTVRIVRPNPRPGDPNYKAPPEVVKTLEFNSGPTKD